jgi:DNA-binding response OmpR family regulator
VVLIVTDDQLLKEGLAALMSTIPGAGGVEHTGNVTAALCAIHYGAVHLVLVDGALPGADLECFFREYARFPTSPPMLLLAESIEQEEAALQLRAHSLVKGGAISELVARIESLLY